ncbi:MAG: YdeI/OmpD-associated family protein [Bacteroidota bacterium]
MPTKDKRVDVYITKAQPFAQPVLKKIRELVHKACPDVTETIKWGMPFFEYKGPMFGMAAFKKHCVGGFWKHKLLNDPKNYLSERKNQGGTAMGNLGSMTSLKDLPPDNAMINFIKQAAKLNDDGVKVIKKPAVKKAIVISRELTDALASNKKATVNFENFSPSQKREYAEWITDAKTETTKNKRLKTSVEWISEGKQRLWKYQKKK